MQVVQLPQYRPKQSVGEDFLSRDPNRAAGFPGERCGSLSKPLTGRFDWSRAIDQLLTSWR
jgi:hypothetical protein